jgi:hypothetical protein
LLSVIIIIIIIIILIMLLDASLTRLSPRLLAGRAMLMQRLQVTLARLDERRIAAAFVGMRRRHRRL